MSGKKKGNILGNVQYTAVTSWGVVRKNRLEREDKTSDKFLCYYFDRCSKAKKCQCSYSEPFGVTKSWIKEERGLKYVYENCQWTEGKTVRCWEVFGIHLIRQYYKDKKHKIEISSINNLEKKIVQLRARVEHLKRKHNVI